MSGSEMLNVINSKENMNEFKGKIIWITGGSKGIGKCLVEQFLDLGAFIITNCTGKNPKEIECFNQEMQGRLVKLFAADVCNEKEIERITKYIDDNYGRLDILINNAGISLDGFIENYDVNIFKEVLNTNVCGKFNVLQKSINLLKKSEYPSVINISSRLSVVPMEQSIGYCCSQAAVAMMTKVAILELSKYNIRVNTVSPSLTETELSTSFYSDEELIQARENNPRQRLGKKEDVFYTVKFLCSKEAEYINGANIHVNGGVVLV